MAERAFRRTAAASRSRTALLRAFADLIQQASYDRIEVCDIARRAKISRSTFYAHFRGKQDILSASIATPFSTLAACLQPHADERALLSLLEHFWNNRAGARALLQTPLRRSTSAVLVREVEKQLRSRTGARTARAILPQRLIAIQIAEVLLAPISAWLLGESRSSPQALACALPRAAAAVLAASYTPSAFQSAAGRSARQMK